MTARHQAPEALRELGGVATWGELLERCGGGPSRRALAEGHILRRGRGRYVTSETGDHLAVAHSLTATLSHLSAALEHGCKVNRVPEQAQVTVPRERTIRPPDRRKVTRHWRDLPSIAVNRGVTRPLQTVLDCAQDLPFDEALAVADSALREHDVDADELVEATEALRGPGSVRARRLARHASAKPDNPVESVLRAIALGVPELAGVVPQLQIWDCGLWAKVDLAEPHLLLVLEADSWSEHGGRRAFRKDCRRYNNLVAWGWTVLRFTWEEVMFQPEYVTWCLVSWLSSQRGGKVLPPPAPLTRFRSAQSLRRKTQAVKPRLVRTEQSGVTCASVTEIAIVQV